MKVTTKSNAFCIPYFWTIHTIQYQLVLPSDSSSNNNLSNFIQNEVFNILKKSKLPRPCKWKRKLLSEN